MKYLNHKDEEQNIRSGFFVRCAYLISLYGKNNNRMADQLEESLRSGEQHSLDAFSLSLFLLNKIDHLSIILKKAYNDCMHIWHTNYEFIFKKKTVVPDCFFTLSPETNKAFYVRFYKKIEECTQEYREDFENKALDNAIRYIKLGMRVDPWVLELAEHRDRKKEFLSANDEGNAKNREETKWKRDTIKFNLHKDFKTESWRQAIDAIIGCAVTQDFAKGSMYQGEIISYPINYPTGESHESQIDPLNNWGFNLMAGFIQEILANFPEALYEANKDELGICLREVLCLHADHFLYDDILECCLIIFNPKNKTFAKLLAISRLCLMWETLFLNKEDRVFRECSKRKIKIQKPNLGKFNQQIRAKTDLTAQQVDFILETRNSLAHPSNNLNKNNLLFYAFSLWLSSVQQMSRHSGKTCRVMCRSPASPSQKR